MSVVWHEDADLTTANTLRLSARADRLAIADDVAGVREVLERAAQAGWPVHVLGGGSNVVLPPRIGGVVLRYADRTIDQDREGEGDGDRPPTGRATTLRIGGAVDWHALVVDATDAGLWGIENLALIPGTVGAAPVQNIGAYGQELATICRGITVVDLDSGGEQEWSAADCDFGYRDSRLRREPGRWLVTDVTLELARAGSARLDYPGVADALGDGARDDPAAVAAAVAALRRAKLPDPASTPNAGSFFKNPVIDAQRHAQLRERDPDLPGRDAGDGTGGTKIPAAWLIERCGWKGFRDGPVGVADGHALVLVHHGGGDGEALMRLADAIRHSVADRFGIDLEPEPVRLGWPPEDGGRATDRR